MADQKVSAQALSNTFGDNDVVTGVQGGANKRFSKTALRSISGISGVWDMTPVDTGTVLDAAYNLEMTTATISAAQYTGTPINGASLIKLAGSGVIKKESAARSARLRASTDGVNFLLSALVLANSDASPADVAASIGAGATGTCTHIAVMYLDNAGLAGPGAMKIAVQTDDPVNSNNTEVLVSTGGYSALDQIYLTFDGTTGLFSVSINAGAAVSGTNAWDISSASSLRAYVLGYHGANPPSLPDSVYDFDFSDNTGGRTGFVTVNDPALPAGAAEFKRYLVSVAGSYGGRPTSVGDIVELHTGTSKIQVTQATPWTSALIEALINPYIAANPSSVQALIDASLAAYIQPTSEYDLETEYATLGGANPGEFEMGPLVNGATLWSSNSAGALSALNTYAAGYTPVPGDSFYFHFNEFDQPTNINFVGTHNTAVATDWRYDQYTAVGVGDFMRTPRKRYQFVYTHIDGINDKWTLQNPDLVAWNTSASGAPLLTGITGNGHGRPGTGITVSSTGNGEIYIPLVAQVATDGAEPFKVGQSCRVIVGTNTTRIRIMGNSSAVGGISFTSNLPVQSIVVGPVNEPAVDIFGSGHAITITYQGNDTWHIFVPPANGGWQSTPLVASSWDNEAGLQAVQHRRSGDVVEMRGNVICVAGGVTTGDCVTAPVGYRPPANLVVPVTVADNLGAIIPSRAILDTSGVLTVAGNFYPNYIIGYNFSFSAS